MIQSRKGVAALEADIWRATERLRGSIEPAQYKNIILSLIFLKYISGITPKEMKRLQLKVPACSNWQVISHASHTSKIGIVIDTALQSMAQENPLLTSVLIPPFPLSDIDQYRLSDVVDVLNTMTGFKDAAECDVLGQVYEYCLDRFAASGGRSTGEFYTPSSVVKLLVDLIEPFEGSVYDPCCGSGGMFVQSARFIEQHAGSMDNVSIYGQESNPVTWSMAYMNLAIRGISANLGSGHADTLHHDLHTGKQFDFVLANPPFNLKNWGSKDTIDDPRWVYGNPPDGNANFAWLQHMLAHLAPNGRLGVILTNGSLSTQRNGEGRIRQAIIEDDLIEGIVTLPGHLFNNTAIAVSIWILDRNKSQPGKTLFIDAQNLGIMTSCRNRVLTDEDILSIHSQFEAFRKGEFQEEKGFSAVATIDEIAQCDFSLVPGRYVGVASSVSDDRDFESTIASLSDELDDLFEMSHALEREIKDNLLQLGKSNAGALN